MGSGSKPSRRLWVCAKYAPGVLTKAATAAMGLSADACRGHSWNHCSRAGLEAASASLLPLWCSTIRPLVLRRPGDWLLLHPWKPLLACRLRPCTSSGVLKLARDQSEAESLVATTDSKATVGNRKFVAGCRQVSYARAV